MSDDFCVEEMMETQFPTTERHGEYDWLFNDIQDWFKRCMAEFPVDTYVPTDKEHVVRIVTPEYEDVEVWFEKWFSQFTTNSEEIEK